MFKKVIALLFVVTILVSMAGCAPSDAVQIAEVSEPFVVSLIGVSPLYQTLDMDTAIDILIKAWEGGEYTIAYMNQYGQYMWGTLYTHPEISGDATAFMFSGDVDATQYTNGAKNFMDVVSNLTNDGWVRVTKTDPAMPAAIAQFMRFIAGVSTGITNVSIFFAPVLLDANGDVIVPGIEQAPHIDT